jgi:hypothetical protein
MERNSTWLKPSSTPFTVSWCLPRIPREKSENSPSRITKTPPRRRLADSPTPIISLPSFCSPTFQEDLTRGTKEPIPSPRKELHHEGSRLFLKFPSQALDRSMMKISVTPKSGNFPRRQLMCGVQGSDSARERVRIFTTLQLCCCGW